MIWIFTFSSFRVLSRLLDGGLVSLHSGWPLAVLRPGVTLSYLAILNLRGDLLAEGSPDLNFERVLHHLQGLLQLQRLAVHYPLQDFPQALNRPFIYIRETKMRKVGTPSFIIYHTV